MPRRSSFRPVLLRISAPWWIVLLVSAFVIVGAWWIWLFQRGQPLDIDEAGYLCLAMIDYYGLHYGGLRGWIAAVGMPSIQAPLMPALTSLLFAVTGAVPYFGFAVPLAGGAGCVGATYALGCASRSRRIGWMAAVLVASCPALIWYSRDYQFSTWAALTTTLALLAIARSERFGSPAWSAIFGVCLGLMPLARTMTIAFVPGMIAAAFLAVVVEPTQRWRRLLNLFGGLVLATLVATPWFVRNGRRVARYLLGFGYGAHASEYGHGIHRIPLFSFSAWLHWVHYIVNAELLFPHFMLVVLGLLALLVIVIRTAVREGLRAAMRYLCRSPLTPVAVFIVEAVAALNSTKNHGSGFIVPVVPALMVAVAWAFEALSISRGWRIVSSSLVAAVALIAAVPNLNLQSPFASVWTADIPVFGAVNLTDGRGNIERYEDAMGCGEGESVEPIDAATGRAWMRLSRRTATILGQSLGPHPSVAFGFRNSLYNVNTVNLARLLQTDSAFDVRQIDPVETGESVGGYLRWLRRDNANVCGLLTSNGVRGNFKPVVNPAFMKEAAQQAGFVPVQQWATPDGQEITLWNHKVAPPNCR